MSLDEIHNLQSYAIGRIAKTITDYTSGNKDAKSDVHGNFVDDSTSSPVDNSDVKLYNAGNYSIRFADRRKNSRIWDLLKDFSDKLEIEFFLQHDRDLGLVGPESTWNCKVLQFYSAPTAGVSLLPNFEIRFSSDPTDNDNFKMIFNYSLGGRLGNKLRYKFKYRSGRFKLVFRKTAPYTQVFINDELAEPEAYTIGNANTEVPFFDTSFWQTNYSVASPVFSNVVLGDVKGFLDDFKITKDGVVISDFSGSESQTYLKNFSYPNGPGRDNYIPGILHGARSNETLGYADKKGTLTGVCFETGMKIGPIDSSLGVYPGNYAPENPKLHGFADIPTFARNLQSPVTEVLTKFTEEGLPDFNINPINLKDKNRAYARYRSTTGSLSSKSLQPVIAQNSTSDLSFPGAVGSSESATDIEWNPDCWYYKKAMTCFSITTKYHAFAGKATLLSPRHAIMARHVWDDYVFNGEVFNSGTMFRDPSYTTHIPSNSRSLTFMDLSGNTQETYWNDYAICLLADTVILHLRDEITIDVAFATFLTQEDLSKGTEFIVPGCGPTKEGYFACEENVAKVGIGVLDKAGIQLVNRDKYFKWSRYNNKIGPNHTRVGDSSTPVFIFNGDTLYLSTVALFAGQVSEGPGISRSVIGNIYNVVDGISSSEAKEEIHRCMSLLSSRNRTGTCSLTQLPMSGTSKQRLHWEGQGFVSLRQPLHIDYMRNTRNGKISFSYKKDTSEIIHKSGIPVVTAPCSAFMGSNYGHAGELVVDRFMFHDKNTFRSTGLFSMNHFQGSSGYHLGMGTYWELGAISGVVAFSGTQAPDSPTSAITSGWPITRKDNHVVDPYIIGQNVTVSNSQVTTAIVWNRFPGSRSTQISAGTKFRTGWARASYSQSNGIKYLGNPASHPISSITPVVTALTDFNTDRVKSPYRYIHGNYEKASREKGFICVDRDLGLKVDTSTPGFTLRLRRTPIFIGSFPLSSGNYTLTFGTTGTKLYIDNKEVQFTTITGSSNSASDLHSVIGSGNVPAGGSVSGSRYSNTNLQYDDGSVSRRRMVFAQNMYGICDNLVITGDANIGFDYTQSTSSHSYIEMPKRDEDGYEYDTSRQPSGVVNYYHDSINEGTIASGLFVNKTGDGTNSSSYTQRKYSRYSPTWLKLPATGFSTSGYPDGQLYDAPGWHEIGHNRCPQYINDYNFAENFDTRKQIYFSGLPSAVLSAKLRKQDIIIKPPTIYDKAYLKYKMSLSEEPGLEHLSGMPIILGFDNDRSGNLYRGGQYQIWPRVNSTSGVSAIERNLDCWYNKKPITCFSVYGNLHTFNTHMTLLSPRHALIASHIFDDFQKDTVFGGAYRAKSVNGYKYTLTAAASAYLYKTTQQLASSGIYGTPITNRIKQGASANAFAYFMDLDSNMQKGIIADFVAGTHPDDPGGQIYNPITREVVYRDGVAVSGFAGNSDGSSFHDMCVVLLKDPITLDVDYATFMSDSDIDTLSAGRGSIIACGPSKEGTFNIEDVGRHLNTSICTDVADPLFEWGRFSNRDAHQDRVGDSSSPGFLYNNNRLYLHVQALTVPNGIYTTRSSAIRHGSIGQPELFKGIQSRYSRNWIQNAMNYLSDINGVPRHDLVVVPLSAE